MLAEGPAEYPTNATCFACGILRGMHEAVWCLLFCCDTFKDMKRLRSCQLFHQYQKEAHHVKRTKFRKDLSTTVLNLKTGLSSWINNSGCSALSFRNYLSVLKRLFTCLHVNNNRSQALHGPSCDTHVKSMSDETTARGWEQRSHRDRQNLKDVLRVQPVLGRAGRFREPSVLIWTTIK